jgi:hypothetical protein
MPEQRAKKAPLFSHLHYQPVSFCGVSGFGTRLSANKKAAPVLPGAALRFIDILKLCF